MNCTFPFTLYEEAQSVWPIRVPKTLHKLFKLILNVTNFNTFFENHGAQEYTEMFFVKPLRESLRVLCVLRGKTRKVEPPLLIQPPSTPRAPR